MKTSEQIDQIATALAGAQAEMKNAKLNKVNSHFKSRYADLAEIRDTITPPLAKYGLALVHGIDPTDNGIHVVSRLVHKSGQWMESRFPISYDKPQVLASGITYAKRYNSSALTNIAADEDDDGNAANDSKPAAMPTVNGTPGASKAGNRASYERFVKEIRAAVSLKELAAWHVANVAEIDKMPPDFIDELRVEYSDRQSELKKGLAA